MKSCLGCKYLDDNFLIPENPPEPCCRNQHINEKQFDDLLNLSLKQGDYPNADNSCSFYERYDNEFSIAFLPGRTYKFRFVKGSEVK